MNNRYDIGLGDIFFACLLAMVMLAIAFCVIAGCFTAVWHAGQSVFKSPASTS